MCGIVGLFTPAGATPPALDLGAMMAAIAHRGPDDQRTYRSADRRFQAGFVRLSIIDLETGGQPIIEPEGARVLLGNGEIYNYLELRQDAAAKDYPFQTKGDMESLLPLLSAKGLDALNELNGMYALALYERGPHTLTLVRDRLGIKPLYWARTVGGGLLFASEVKALLASGLIGRAVNEDAVSAYLAHGYVPAPHTLYRGVFKLPPGSVLTVDAAGEVHTTRLWRPAPAQRTYASAQEATEVLTALLKDCVRLQLRSDVPVGALLSGGVDSGLMVALAAQQMDRPLQTYTVRFAGAAYDESPLAAQVAERYGTDHTVLTLAQDSIATALPRLAWYADEPLADASLLPNQLIEDAIKGRSKVVLNGTGGDELFAGYGRYFQMGVEARYLRLPALLRRTVKAAVDPYTAWRLERAEMFDTDPGGYLHAHSTYFPPPIRALIGNRLPPPDAAQRQALEGQSGDRQALSLIADLSTYLPEDLLLLLDRTTMAASLEGRVPFLDHRLVEATLAVPPHVRTPEGRQKGLQRDIARPFLPEGVLTAPKQGFASPVPAWMRAGLGPLARALLTRPQSLERGWWTQGGIDRLLADPDRHAHRVYALLSLEMAVRLHVEEGRATPPTEGLEAYANG